MTINRIFFVILLLISSLVCTNSYADNKKKAKKDTQKIQVKVAKAVKKDMSSKISAMGTVNYIAKADVSSEIAGILRSVSVEEGDTVRKGQTIAVIDSTLLQAQLKKALAAQELAEINLLKWDNEVRKTQFHLEAAGISMEKLKDYLETRKKLFDIGGITLSELNEAEINYQKSLASYKSALEDSMALKAKSKEGRNSSEVAAAKANADTEEVRAQLKKCKIKAPIQGIVSSKKKWAGERLGPGDSVILTIIGVNNVYAEAELNEKSVGLVTEGQDAEVAVDAYPDKSFTGKVHKISPTIDKNSRTFKVKVKVSNENRLLKPGMFVRIKIILNRRNKVVTVPKEAILMTKDGNPIVFVIIDEVAFLRKVQTGLKEDNRVVIKKGVKDGERVVIEGYERLKDLDAVTSMETGAK